MTGVPVESRLTWAPPTLKDPITLSLAGTDGAIDLAKVAAALKEERAKARYVMAALA
jgi:hypothetical protein